MKRLVSSGTTLFAILFRILDWTYPNTRMEEFALETTDESVKQVRKIKTEIQCESHNQTTVELQWLEPRWLVYHGWVEYVLESAGISSKYDKRIT